MAEAFYRTFRNCSSLTSIDLSSWDIINRKYIYNMLSGCTSIVVAYGRTQSDCDRLNSLENKPDNINFIVKP